MTKFSRTEIEEITKENVVTFTVDVPLVVSQDGCSVAGFFEEALMRQLDELESTVDKGKYRLRLLAILTEDER